MTESEIKNFLEIESECFHENYTIEEYRSDIKAYLMLCSWHYLETDADRILRVYRDAIRENYAKQIPVADTALDIGYACG